MHDAREAGVPLLCVVLGGLSIVPLLCPTTLCIAVSFVILAANYKNYSIRVKMAARTHASPVALEPTTSTAGVWLQQLADVREIA